eukprot:6025618-Amphidinium_carterae.1
MRLQRWQHWALHKRWGSKTRMHWNEHHKRQVCLSLELCKMHKVCFLIAKEAIATCGLEAQSFENISVHSTFCQ